MSPQSKTMNPYGVLRINPNAQLTEAITSIKGAKATWNDEPEEDICEAASVDPPTSKIFRKAVISRVDGHLLEAQLLESKESEAQMYAKKEKLREQVRLLQESHCTKIRQKDTEIWNLKGELHHNNSYACRREMSLNQ